MLKEILIQNYKPETVDNEIVSVCYSDNWYFEDVEKNRFVPLSIEKLHVYSDEDEGYRLVNRTEQTSYFSNPPSHTPNAAVLD